MFTRLVTLAFPLILTHFALADTFTWSGQNGNFSDPASWTGPTPIPGGTPTDNLRFPPNSNLSPQTAVVDLPGPWTLNSLNLNLYSGATVALAGLPSASLSFAGPNPGIFYSLSSGNAASINVPVSSSSDLTFSSDNWASLTLTGALTSTGSNSKLIIANSASLHYANSTAPNFSQTVLGSTSNGFEGVLQWSVSVAGDAPNALAFGPGPIVFHSGIFQINLLAPSDAASVYAMISNPLIVTDTAGLAVNTTAKTASVNLTFTGPITLGGRLLTRSSRDYQSYLVPTTITLAGSITLDQSSSQQMQLVDNLSAPGGTIIAGNIVDDPNPSHTTRQPLHLVGSYDSTSPVLAITGTANTYSVGTVIDSGTIAIAPNSSLGTGTIAVAYGTLQLSSPASLHPGQQVTLQYPQAALSINFDQSPYALLDPASLGILAIDTTFYTPLDMSQLGNGQMALGTSHDGIYAATSLHPAADHAYRFLPPVMANPYSHTLTLLHSVLVDVAGAPSSAELNAVTLAAPNSYSGGSTITQGVYVNAPGALGTGDVTIGVPLYNDSYSGRLYLSAPNAYAATAHVNVYGTLAAVGADGAVPATLTPPTLYPGSFLQLGDGLSNNSDRYPNSLPIALNTSTLLLMGTGVTTETVGPISVSGVCVITLQNPPGSPNSTTLMAPAITHADHAVLFINVINGRGTNSSWFGDPTNIPVTFNPADPNNATLRLASAPTVTHGMVAPWIQSRDFNGSYVFGGDASFLTYTASGFALPTYTPLPASGGTGTEIVDVPPTPVDSPVSLAADCSVYALRAANSILNADGAHPTLSIKSGGLIFSTGSSEIQPAVDFADAEAFINVTGNPYSAGGGPTGEISGPVTATNGLSKIGHGTLRLSNPNNQINGPLIIHEGTLELANLPSPNSTDPIFLSGDANLNFLQSAVVSRPVITSMATNFIPWGCSISAPAGCTLTIAAPITGDGRFTLNAGTVRIAAPVNVFSLTIYGAGEIALSADITATSYFGLYGRLTGSSTITSTGLYFNETTFAPGASPGDLGQFIMITPILDLGYETTLEFDLAPNGLSDRIIVTGDVIIDPLSDLGPDNPSDFRTLALNFLTPPTGDTYTLISAASLTGTFFQVTGLPDGYTLQYSPTSLLLVPTASTSIPEPTSLLLLLPSLALLTRRKTFPNLLARPRSR